MTIKSVSCRSRIPNKTKGWSGSWISILPTELPHFIWAFTAIQHLKERCKDEITLCNVPHRVFRGCSKAARQKLEVTYTPRGATAAEQGHWKHPFSQSYSWRVQSLMGAHWSEVLSPHCSILSQTKELKENSPFLGNNTLEWIIYIPKGQNPGICTHAIYQINYINKKEH